MQTSFVRTLVVCGACVTVAAALEAQAAAFPLLITAMASHVRGRAELVRVATQLVSHVVSAAGSATVGLWLANRHALGQGGEHAAFLIGCLLLLSLQFTGLRHPPAMASGGAVLCGIDPLAVIACVAITGSLLFAEPLLLRVWRSKR
jgi:hypothetical protein